MKIEFPCLNVRLVPISKVQANDYNPNKMESKMFRLLKKSIIEDGLTMPIVTFYDIESDKYIIVDGFHRYTVLLKMKIEEIPVSVIEKSLDERRISTIRHNKAKGTHQLDLIKKNFFELINSKSLSLADISEKLGLEAEEVIIYNRGVNVACDLGKDNEYSNSWERNPNDKILYKNKKYDEYEKR